MGLEDLRKKLAAKKASSETSRDVWHNNIVVDPYFPRAAYYVISKGRITAADLAYKFVIDGPRIKNILNQLVQYHVVFRAGDKYLACMPKSLLDTYLSTYKLMYEDLPVDNRKAAFVVEKPKVLQKPSVPKTVINDVPVLEKNLSSETISAYDEKKKIAQRKKSTKKKAKSNVKQTCAKQKGVVNNSDYLFVYEDSNEIIDEIGHGTNAAYSVCADCGCILPKGRALCDECMAARLKSYNNKVSADESDDEFYNAVRITENGRVPVHVEDVWSKYPMQI